VAVGEAFPTGPAFLLAKSSFPSLKTPTVLSQQELGNPVGKAFANRVGVFANAVGEARVSCCDGPEYYRSRCAYNHHASDNSGCTASNYTWRKSSLKNNEHHQQFNTHN
jgi:hypothetical protein